MESKYFKRPYLYYKELKVGDKYYDEGIVYVLLEIDFDENNPDDIDVVRKQWKTNKIEHIHTHGKNILEAPKFKYTGRDKSSFFAGFDAAMKMCLPYMDIFNLENAGFENEINIFLKMREAYNVWKLNNFK